MPDPSHLPNIWDKATQARKYTAVRSRLLPLIAEYGLTLQQIMELRCDLNDAAQALNPIDRVLSGRNPEVYRR